MKPPHVAPDGQTYPIKLNLTREEEFVAVARAEEMRKSGQTLNVIEVMALISEVTNYISNSRSNGCDGCNEFRRI